MDLALRALLNRALAGDVEGAGAAAQQYVQAVGTMPRGANVSSGRLTGQRAQLELAIARGPASTRSSLQRALVAVDATLSGTSPAPAQSSAPASDSAPSHDAAPAVSRQGSGEGNPRPDSSTGSSDSSDQGSRGLRGDGHDNGDGSSQAQSMGDRRGEH